MKLLYACVHMDYALSFALIEWFLKKKNNLAEHRGEGLSDTWLNYNE